MKDVLELVIDREHKAAGYTISNLFANGVKFCDTLEDTDRGLKQTMSLAEIKAKKIYGVTAIPSGTYDVVLSYSPKFKRILPEVKNVIGYSGVRIHAGNKPDHTLGCPLVGINTNRNVAWIGDSRKWEEKLIELMKQYRSIKLTIK